MRRPTSNDIGGCRGRYGGGGAKGKATFCKNLSDDSSVQSVHGKNTCLAPKRSRPFHSRNASEREGSATPWSKSMSKAPEKVWVAVETSKATRFLVMEMLAPEIEAGPPRQDHSRNRSQGLLHKRLRS